MLAALLPILTPLLGKLLESVIPDPQARQKELDRMLGALAQSDLSQLEVNKAEAGSGNLFIAGWRPFIGWVCGTALAYTYLFAPLAYYVGFLIGKPIPKLPTLDGNLYELMLGMLGMAGLRTFEKIKTK
ncbi:MAG TPA: 3TM-type holin [Sphingomicrobium sp.]|nr:3TM-type holin [Sphingomicrobium sp.]